MLSVFGSIIFVGLLMLGAVAMVTIGIFWPVLLIAAVIWLATHKKSTTADINYKYGEQQRI